MTPQVVHACCEDLLSCGGTEGHTIGRESIEDKWKFRAMTDFADAEGSEAPGVKGQYVSEFIKVKGRCGFGLQRFD